MSEREKQIGQDPLISLYVYQRSTICSRNKICPHNSKSLGSKQAVKYNGSVFVSTLHENKNHFLSILTLRQQREVEAQVSVTGHTLEPVFEIEDFVMNVIFSTGGGVTEFVIGLL